jgi:Chitobiase/beta-hexosaminidase C-terminal domain/Fn3 associated
MKKLLTLAILVPAIAHAQLWSGLLNTNRAPQTAWTTAGAGSIPARTTICTTLGTAGQAPTFAQSVSAANIVSALQGCPSGQTVLLNPGTYSMTTTIFGPGDGGATPSNVTLRGSGPQQTILTWNNSSALNTCSGIGGAAFCIYNGDSGWGQYATNVLQWTSGYAQGATSLTVGAPIPNLNGGGGSLSNLKVGALMMINQCDDGFSGYTCAGTPADNGNFWVCGEPYYCTWGGNGSSFPNAGLTQMVTVTGISGSTVTFTPGIYSNKFTSARSPFVSFSSSLPVTGFGLENLQLNTQNVTTSAASMVDMMWAQNSWVKNTAQVNNAVRDQAMRLHTVVQASSHITIRDSYFYGGSPSSDDYAADFQWTTSDSLAENNIGQHISSSWMTETATGNVFGYNYAVDNFFGGAWQQCDMVHHGEGDYYNLYEGEEGICAYLDDSHGTSFADTFFRGYWSGFDPVTTCPGGGLACYNATGGTPPKVQNTCAFCDQAFDRYNNVVLSVFGDGSYANTYQNVGAQGSPNSCPGYTWNVLFSLNFANGNQTPFSASCQGSSYTIDNDALVTNSLVRWGNFDTVTNTIRTNSGETASSASTYPGLASPNTTWAAYPSLYLSGTPSWWVFPNGTTCPWPSIGPDITGGAVAGGHVCHIPAANCYLNVLGGQVNGSSGPLPFDANVCYANSTPTVATPVTSPASGTYATTQTVTATTTTSGATICFTNDGTTPTAPTAGTCSGGTTQTYTTGITVSSTTTLRFIGTKSGLLNSGVSGGTWTISTPTLAAPAYSPDGNLTGDGYFLSNPTVTMSSASVIASEENVQDGLTGWDECYIGTCPGGGTPGGSGTPSAVVQTINNATPSLSGASMKLGFTTSQNNTNVLWTYTGNGCDECDSLNSNFELYPPATSTGVGALEMDMFNFDVTDNTEFMFGFQWNQTSGVWQVFNQNLGTWVSTSVTTGPTYGAWNHIQIFNHRVPGDTSACSGKPCMHYDYFILNGTTYTLNMSEPAGTLPGGWTSAIGFQFQMDSTTVSGATTFTEYLDEASLNVAPNIYYTTNGTTPSTSSTLYTAPFALTINTSGVPLQSIAAQAGYLNSPVTSSTYSQRNIIVHSHNSANAGNTTVNSISTTVTASAGDGIECGVVFGSSIPTVTLSDNKNTGNYASCVSPYYSGLTFASVGKFYMTGAASGSTTVTANFSQAIQYVGLGCRTLTPAVAGTFMCDPSASPAPPSVDQSTANPATSGATPAHASELISCDLVTGSGAATAGANYFLGDVMPGGPNLFREYQIQNTAASANCPYTFGATASTDQQAGYYFANPTPAATPTFAPSSGTYSTTQTIALACSSPSSTIYYTEDGTTPSTSSTLYTGTFTLSSTATIRAICTASGFSQSAVGSATYTINTGLSSPPLLKAVQQ